MDPTVPEVAQVLAALGCPAGKAEEMASQLIKRAGQLAKARGRTEEEALNHLVRLMAGGWAAQAPEGRGSISDGVEPWEVLSQRLIGDYRIFSLHTSVRRNPRTGTTHDFYVIDCPAWVNVCALTRDRQLVMIEQFRHGTSTIELEIPGGMMDAQETDPVAAGLRELQEETGFTGRNARLIGTVFPNPAIQSNRCHTILVEDCVRTHELDLDHGEDIALRLIPALDAPRLVQEGAIRHALVVAALFYLQLLQPIPATITR